MNLEGPFEFLDDTYPDTVRLGEHHGAHGDHDVFLALGRWGWSCSLGTLLAERMLAERPAIVFTPTTRGIPITQMSRFGIGSRVVLGILADVVGQRDGTLRLLPSFDRLFGGVAGDVPAFCIAYTSEGKRSLSRREYDEVVERASEFDLFIDAAVPSHSRNYNASRRTLDRKWHRQRCPRWKREPSPNSSSRAGHPASPLGPRGFARNPSTTEGHRIGAEQGRRTLARFKWRAFHTMPDETPSERRYVFRPPASLSFVVLTHG